VAVSGQHGADLPRLHARLIPRLQQQEGSASVGGIVNGSTVTGPRGLELDGVMDVVLVDAPCSTDREMVTRWMDPADDGDPEHGGTSWSHKDSSRLSRRQSSLLVGALRLCRVGGTVVYSTCSPLWDQNEGAMLEGLRRAAGLGMRGHVVRDWCIGSANRKNEERGGNDMRSGGSIGDGIQWL